MVCRIQATTDTDADCVSNSRQCKHLGRLVQEISRRGAALTECREFTLNTARCSHSTPLQRTPQSPVRSQTVESESEIWAMRSER